MVRSWGTLFGQSSQTIGNQDPSRFHGLSIVCFSINICLDNLYVVSLQNFYSRNFVVRQHFIQSFVASTKKNCFWVLNASSIQMHSFRVHRNLNEIIYVKFQSIIRHRRYRSCRQEFIIRKISKKFPFKVFRETRYHLIIMQNRVTFFFLKTSMISSLLNGSLFSIFI